MRYKVKKRSDGTIITESIRVPGEQGDEGLAMDEALATQRPAERRAQEKEPLPQRKKIVKRADGSVEVVGGPGPSQPSGFDDIIEDDEPKDIELEPEDAENADVDDTDDIDAANEATAEVKAAEEVEEEKEPEVQKKFPCSVKGCGFAAVTQAGLSSHKRAKHG